MKRFTNCALAGIIALFSLIALTGCAPDTDVPQPPPTVYSIKLYGDDIEPLRTFSTTRISTGESVAWVQVEGDSEYTRIGGTFVIEPEGATSAAERAPDSKYKVTLYVGNKVLRTWFVSHITTGEGIAWIKTSEAKDYTRVNGTFVIEPLK